MKLFRSLNEYHEYFGWCDDLLEKKYGNVLLSAWMRHNERH